MVRSFQDRVFGGVCGGLAERLRLGSWLVRLVFVVLSLLSLGAVTVAYLGLWWLAPQASPALERTPGLSVIVVLALLLLTVGLWVARLTSALNPELYWPGLALLLALIFFVRQLRG